MKGKDFPNNDSLFFFKEKEKSLDYSTFNYVRLIHFSLKRDVILFSPLSIIIFFRLLYLYHILRKHVVGLLHSRVVIPLSDYILGLLNPQMIVSSGRYIYEQLRS